MSVGSYDTTKGRISNFTANMDLYLTSLCCHNPRSWKTSSTWQSKLFAYRDRGLQFKVEAHDVRLIATPMTGT